MVNKNKGHGAHHKKGKGKGVEYSSNCKHEVETCSKKNDKNNKKKKSEKNKYIENSKNIETNNNVEIKKYVDTNKNTENNKNISNQKKDENTNILKAGGSSKGCGNTNFNAGSSTCNIGFNKEDPNNRCNGTKETKSHGDESKKICKSGNAKVEEKKGDQKREVFPNEQCKNTNNKNKGHEKEVSALQKNSVTIKGTGNEISKDETKKSKNKGKSKEREKEREKQKEKEKGKGKGKNKDKEKKKNEEKKMQNNKLKNIVIFNNTPGYNEQTDVHTESSVDFEMKSNRTSENTKKGDESNYLLLHREKGNETDLYFSETVTDVGKENVLKKYNHNEKSVIYIKSERNIFSEASGLHLFQNQKRGMQQKIEEENDKNKENVKTKKQDENMCDEMQKNVKKGKNGAKKISEYNNIYDKTNEVYTYENNFGSSKLNNLHYTSANIVNKNTEKNSYTEDRNRETNISQNSKTYLLSKCFNLNADKGTGNILLEKCVSNNITDEQSIEQMTKQTSQTQKDVQHFNLKKNANIRKYTNDMLMEKNVSKNGGKNDEDTKKIKNENNTKKTKIQTKPSLEELLLEKKKLLEKEEKEKKKQKTYSAEIIRCELIWGPTKNKEPITPVESCELHPVVIIKDKCGHLYDDDEDNENNPIGKTANIYYRWSRGPPRTVCFFHPQKISCLQCTATSRCFCSYECFIKGFVQLHKYYKTNDTCVLPSHPNIHTYGVPCSPFDWENYENNMEFDEQHYNSLIQAGLLSMPNEEKWETIHNERNYVPCAKDIGHQLRLETLLLDKNGEYTGMMGHENDTSEDDETEKKKGETNVKEGETMKKLEEEDTEGNGKGKENEIHDEKTGKEDKEKGQEKKEKTGGSEKMKETDSNEYKQANDMNYEFIKTYVSDVKNITGEENMMRLVGYEDVHKIFQNLPNTSFNSQEQFFHGLNENVSNHTFLSNKNVAQGVENPYIAKEHIMSDNIFAATTVIMNDNWKDTRCITTNNYTNNFGINCNNTLGINYNQSLNTNCRQACGESFISNMLEENENKGNFRICNEYFYQTNEMKTCSLVNSQFENKRMNEIEKNTKEDIPTEADIVSNNNNVPSNDLKRENSGYIHRSTDSISSIHVQYLNSKEQEKKKDIFCSSINKRAFENKQSVYISNNESQLMNTAHWGNEKERDEEKTQNEKKTNNEVINEKQKNQIQKNKKKVYILDDKIWNIVKDPRIYRKIITGCCIPNLNVFPSYNITCFKNSHLSNPHNQFTIMTWNVLAEIYGTVEAFPYCDPYMLAWSYRKTKIIQEILNNSPDIVCLQEIQNEHFLDFFKPSLSEFGYEGVYKQKTKEIFTSPSGKRRGGKYTIDGCAIFYNTRKLNFVETYALEFSKLIKEASVFTLPKEIQKKPAVVKRLLKDNVALVLLLEYIQQYSKIYDKNEDRKKKKLLIVANTHIVANPEANYVKIWQAQMLVKVIEYLKINFIKKYETIPSIIICGDFNSTPTSAVYQLIYKKKCDRNHEDFNSDKYSLLTELQLGHNLNLKSAYAISKLLSQKLNPDHCQNLELFEPLFTNYTGNFIGCLDYIFYNDENLNIISTVNVADEHQLMEEAQLYQLSNWALPSPIRPSDHLPLVAKFEFKIC